MKNVIYSVIIIIIFFALLEFATRVLTDEKKPKQDDNIQYIVDSDTLWQYKPDQFVLQTSKGINYIINSKGLRGTDFPLKKPEGEKRLLAIGDSVTFGHLVSEENTYPNFLQEYLNKIISKSSFRVINCGVNAYSTREELMSLRKKWIEYNPDIVLLGFVLNDASIYARQYQLKKFGKILTHTEQQAVLRLSRRILSKIRFVDKLSLLIETVLSKGKSEQNVRAMIDDLDRDIMCLDSKESINGWETAIDELSEIKQFLDGHNIDMVLIIFPTLYQVKETPTQNEPQERMKEFCRINMIPFLDLLPNFINRNPDSLYIDLVHLKPYGNAVVASEICNFLLENEILTVDSSNS